MTSTASKRSSNPSLREANLAHHAAGRVLLAPPIGNMDLPWATGVGVRNTVVASTSVKRDLRAASDRPSYNSADVSWIAMLLPITLSLRSFSQPGVVLLLAALAGGAVVGISRDRRPTQFGPLVLLAASCAIVYSRATNKYDLAILLCMFVLTISLTVTVDARTIIRSLFDGIGLYLILNVLGYVAGLRSSGSGDRVGGIVEASGFTRRIFPFALSLDAAPTVASVYLAAVVFLLRESGSKLRIYRLVCSLAGFAVLFGSGVRTGILIAVLLPIVVMLFPSVISWSAQAATLFAAVSYLVAPPVARVSGSLVALLMSVLAPNRTLSGSDIASLSNRDKIWSRSINFWLDYVGSPPQQLFGFGQGGQYRSGASMSYRELLSAVSRHPERGSVHNSFLQQLFDGGLVGLLLLAFAILWTSVRLARQARDWGYMGVAAILATTALLLNSVSQVSLAPGFSQESFWILMVLVGVACQKSRVG